jgi:hypothetical protein
MPKILIFPGFLSWAQPHQPVFRDPFMMVGFNHLPVQHLTPPYHLHSWGEKIDTGSQYVAQASPNLQHLTPPYHLHSWGEKIDTGSQYVAQASPKLVTLLLQPLTLLSGSPKFQMYLNLKSASFTTSHRLRSPCKHSWT